MIKTDCPVPKTNELHNKIFNNYSSGSINQYDNLSVQQIKSITVTELIFVITND